MIRENLKKINGKNIFIKTAGNKNKNAIIFIHGNSQDGDTWLPQLKDPELNKHYFLVAIDLPGHGKSDWLNNKEDYRPGKLAQVIAALIGELNIKHFIIAGLSYGSNITGEFKQPVNGCAGIVLASPCIINAEHTAADILTPGIYGYVVTAEKPAVEDIRSFACSHINEMFAENFVESYLKTDPAFRPQLSAALMEGDVTDELKNIQNLHVPVCIVFGKNETLLKNNYLDDFKPLWNNKVNLIENAGHLPNEENSVAFNILLKEFASDVF